MTAPMVYLPTSGDGASGLVDDRHLVTVSRQLVGDRQRRQAVVLGDHDHPAPEPLGVEDRLAGGEDARQVGARHVDTAWRGAGRDGNDVRARGHDVVARRVAIEVHVHSDPGEPPLLPVDPAPKLRFIRSRAATASWPPSAPSRSQSRTRWPRSAICPANSVPAGPPPITSTDRGAVAGGGRPSSSRPACGLTPHANGRPSTTRRSMHSWTPMHGRTSAARPSPDLTTSSGSAIAALREPDEVGVPVGEDAFGGGDAGHPPDVDDGQIGRRSRLPGERRPLGLGVEARLDVADPAPVVADVEAEVVDRPVGRERGEQRLAVVDRLAAVDHLVEAEPQADGDRPVDVVAHRLDDLPEQPASVLEAAAVPVGAAVRPRRQEPLEDVVVVGVQLEGVGVALGGECRPTRRTPAPATRSRRASRAWGMRWSA